MDNTNGWRAGSLGVIHATRETFVQVRRAYYHRNYIRPDSDEFPIWAVLDMNGGFWVLVEHEPGKRWLGWQQVDTTTMEEAQAVALIMERMQ